MTASNHTEHYNLSQFVDTDRPTFTGDYNGDMSKIDAAIYAASQTGSTSGLTEVAHTTDLTGDGTDGNPLGVADTIARTGDIPSLDGYATTESVTQAIAAAIADRLTAGDIKAGNGINIESSGNTVTISYVGGGSSGGLSAVAHDSTLTGDGTAATPLGVVDGTAINPVNNEWKDIDFNEFYKSGIYSFNGTPTNGPTDQWITGVLIVSRSFQLVAQLVIADPLSPSSAFCFRYARTVSNSGPPSEEFSAWQSIAVMSDIPDVSALTSRIATLESQVAALAAAATPSATGLTATQLDTQYSDDYNIVRVGTPTRKTESEEPSHE